RNFNALALPSEIPAHTRMRLRQFSAVLVSLIVVAALARAEAPAVKPVQMIIGFGPGGGYDLWCRTVARYIGRHLPRHPTLISQNMPGAGSYTAASYLCNTAPRDGTVLGIIARDAALGPLSGATGALRSHQAVVDRNAGKRNECVHRLPHGTSPIRDGFIREATDPRRYRSGHRHAQLSEGSQRANGNEIQDHRRISGILRRFSGDGARGGRGHLRKPRQHPRAAAGLDPDEDG